MHELPRYSSFGDVEEVAGVHHRCVDHHVVVEELRRAGGVRHDAADGPGDEEHVVGTVGLEPVVDRALVAEVELVTGRGQHVRVPRGREAAEHGRTDQASVAGDEDPRVGGHRLHGLPPGRDGRTHWFIGVILGAG